VQEFRNERIVIAVDVREGMVAHSGWLELENLGPSTFISTMAEAGATCFLCTTIQRDGMLEGPDIEFYSRLRVECPQLQFIASGGVSQISDLHDLEKAGCWAVVVGKALYEGRIKTAQLAGFRAG
jgi:phosphoribosylformimino-5-aminoimidazole carboxamide ribotide isomerase